MAPKVSSREEEPPDFSYGSVWLIGACDPNQLSSIALHALRTADAVIHDPGVSADILDLVQPPRYREVALPRKAIQRTVKLARDGWRIVRLVEGDPLARDHAIEGAAKLSDYDIPFRIIPIASEPSISAVSIISLMTCKPRLDPLADPQTVQMETAMVFVPILSVPPEARFGNRTTMNAHRPQEPLAFSMSGLAG